MRTKTFEAYGNARKKDTGSAGERQDAKIPGLRASGRVVPTSKSVLNFSKLFTMIDDSGRESWIEYKWSYKSTLAKTGNGVDSAERRKLDIVFGSKLYKIQCPTSGAAIFCPFCSREFSVIYIKVALDNRRFYHKKQIPRSLDTNKHLA